MNKEQEIFCDMVPERLRSFHDRSRVMAVCKFRLSLEQYGKSIAVRALCTEHDGGEAVIALSVSTISKGPE